MKESLFFCGKLSSCAEKQRFFAVNIGYFHIEMRGWEIFIIYFTN